MFSTLTTITIWIFTMNHSSYVDSDETLVWIQHSEIENYYEDLLYVTPTRTSETLQQSKISDSSMNEAEKPNLKRASPFANESPESKRARNGFRQLRSGVNSGVPSLRNTISSPTSTTKKLMKRISTIGKSSSNLVCEFSSLKLLSKPEKETLCKADITLFSELEDDIDFPALPDESGVSSLKDLKKVRKNWPIGDTDNIHKILFRDIHKIDRNRLYRIPSEKKSRKLKRISSKMLQKEEKDYIKIHVRTGAGNRTARALPCLEHGNQLWYVADGFVEKQYFTIEKTTEAETFEVTGLLVFAPQVDENFLHDQLKLENLFRAAQKWVANTQQRIDLCLLDDFHKFTLCSVAFAAWQGHQKIPQRKWHLMKNSGANLCSENVILKSGIAEKDVTSITDIPANLLACAVDGKIPAFYITANEGSLKSAFIVRSRGVRDFVLSMHLTSITVLDDVKLKDLLIDHTQKTGILLINRPRSFYSFREKESYLPSSASRQTRMKISTQVEAY